MRTHKVIESYANAFRMTLDATQGISPEERRQMDYLSRGIYIDPDIHDAIELARRSRRQRIVDWVRVKLYG